ncbi:hypothetical protein GGS21DRAFT_26408 [Xylaria nigripes]|nr:hypothetical protein GGS21DRAFT_26408 [Xylaria nigripes]
MANQTPQPTQQNAAKRSAAADDIIEAKVKGAVDAYQRGQYRSIRAAATAYDAPYHRTRSRCQGHHSRGQNGGNSTAHNADVSDQTSHVNSPSSSRRSRKARVPQHLPTTNSAEFPAPEAVIRQRKTYNSPRLAVPGASSDPSSTNDLLRELLKRIDKHEATVRADSASLEKTLIEQVSAHMLQQQDRIGRLERELSDVMAGITEQAKEIMSLRQSFNERFDTVRGDFRLLRKTLDNGISN